LEVKPPPPPLFHFRRLLHFAGNSPVLFSSGRRHTPLPAGLPNRIVQVHLRRAGLLITDGSLPLPVSPVQVPQRKPLGTCFRVSLFFFPYLCVFSITCRGLSSCPPPVSLFFSPCAALPLSPPPPGVSLFSAIVPPDKDFADASFFFFSPIVYDLGFRKTRLLGLTKVRCSFFSCPPPPFPFSTPSTAVSLLRTSPEESSSPSPHHFSQPAPLP